LLQISEFEIQVGVFFGCRYETLARIVQLPIERVVHLFGLHDFGLGALLMEIQLCNASFMTLST
jgi:hypothetical protein